MMSLKRVTDWRSLNHRSSLIGTVIFFTAFFAVILAGIIMIHETLKPLPRRGSLDLGRTFFA